MAVVWYFEKSSIGLHSFPQFLYVGILRSKHYIYFITGQSH